MSWIDVATVVLLTLLATYGSIAVVMWIAAERYERAWRAKLDDKVDDRG
jgi:hypothetical protein